MSLPVETNNYLYASRSVLRSYEPLKFSINFLFLVTEPHIL